MQPVLPVLAQSKQQERPMNENKILMPEARYILPTFEERTSYGYKRQDPYNKLFEDRIVFLGVQVDDASADDVMAQLLVLESQDPDRDITMYINSPGGSFTAMTAIYDTMQYIRPQIQTVCLGQAASAAAVLLAAGAPGKRLALPNARILIHQPASGGDRGQASDIEIQAREMMRLREWLEETISNKSLLFNPNDVSSIASVMTEVLINDDLWTQSLRDSNRKLSVYSWTSVAQKLLKQIKF
jgi:ATP-dependent Clp protease protease subunit